MLFYKTNEMDKTQIVLGSPKPTFFPFTLSKFKGQIFYFLTIMQKSTDGKISDHKDI